MLTCSIIFIVFFVFELLAIFDQVHNTFRFSFFSQRFIQAIVQVNFCVFEISKILRVWFRAVQIINCNGHVVTDNFSITHPNTQQ